MQSKYCIAIRIENYMTYARYQKPCTLPLKLWCEWTGVENFTKRFDRPSLPFFPTRILFHTNLYSREREMLRGELQSMHI